jgi:FkbM family methyltransferase
VRIKGSSVIGKGIYTLEINGTKVKYSLAHEHSKEWFWGNCKDGIHEPEITGRLISCKTECFVDIGAHLGWYTCLVAKLNPQATVYAFEPNSMVVPLLNENIVLNNLTNVHVCQVAVGDRNGFAWIPANDYRPGLEIIDHSKENTLRVNVVSLDQWFGEDKAIPDLIKIDAEGSEWPILAGGRVLLLKHYPRVMMELHPNKAPGQFALIEECLEGIYSTTEERMDEKGKRWLWAE